ncbi:MAG: cell division protein SepF [Micromonosporaceae bacterium]|jgi:cell division inhibitor SepF
MSALRRAGVWLGLIEDDDDDELYDEPEPVGRRERGRAGRRGRHDDDDEYGDGHAPRSELRGVDDAEDPVVPRSRAGDRRREDDVAVRTPARDSTVSYLAREGRPRQADRHSNRDDLAPAPPAEQAQATSGERTERRYQITTLHPTTFREARTIGEHFRQGNPVIMNLTEMDEADARRLVDFGAGLVFGLRGTMDRVTNRVFLLSPANVEVTPEDKARIAEGGFFRQR